MAAPNNNHQEGLLSPSIRVPDNERTLTPSADGDRPVTTLSIPAPAAGPAPTQGQSLSPTSDSPSSDRPNSPDANRLMIQRVPSQASQSLDGETLRSRSASFNSSADTAVRSRANSEACPAPSKDAYDDVPVSEALNPDPRNVQDFQVEDNKFAFSPGQMNKMLNPKSLAAFQALGGLYGLAKGLRTDLTAGLSVDEGRLEGSVSFEEATSFSESQKESTMGASASNSDSQFADRIRVFKQNRLPPKKSAGILKLLWMAYNDKIIILLTIAAVISLSLGIYETVSSGHGVNWVEGVAICVAIAIVTIVTAANDWQKERQFKKLNKKNDDREVRAIRSGKTALISIHDITVGDILHLEPGDTIPTDGIMITGHGVKCDESSATGESDQMKKTNGYEVWQRIMAGTATKKLDPFMISGSKILEGMGTYLVTSVGPYSTYGRILLSLQESNDPTPLQAKLGKLADWIGWLGSGAAIILFFVLLFRWIANLDHNSASPAVKGMEFVDILIVAITVIVVAIPEGLPLAVTLALAFATTRMVKENNLVRVLRACETMGNGTVVCSDKTGTLTQNKMTVVAGSWGSGKNFSQLPEDSDSSNSSMNPSEVFKQCSTAMRNLIIKSMALNSTAFEGDRDGIKEFLGSKTEVALLQMAKDYLGMDLAAERSSAETVQLIPFDSSRKCMGVVYREPSVGYRLLVKGAAEIMVDACSTRSVDDGSGDCVTAEKLSDEERQKVLDTIESYAERSLRTIGLVYRDFASWPPTDAQMMEDDPSSVKFEDLFRDMTWAGVVGIQDPLRPEVPGAIQKCHIAGVQVKMVTGDNMATATAIASSSGIKTEDGIAMEGPVFRQLPDDEMDQVIPRLQVLARSSPEDKRILVEHLKKLGETVAVTGDGTNDGPALKTADVGFSMGLSGTEVAKEASSIILLDDNFKSIVTAIAWGRAVNDAVAKFLQFQITVNITAVVLTFVSSVSSDSNQSVLNAVQLLWVNLIMDTFAALALATDPPTEKILHRKPAPKKASLFTITMWKMILGQAVYQLAVTFMLYFAGDKIIGRHLGDKEPQKVLATIVFNTFVWMQIFNQYNNRRLDNHFNVFEAMHRNLWFLGISTIMVGVQIMIIFVGGAAFGVTPLDGVQWGICIVCAIACLPWAIVVRLVPDKQFGIVFNLAVGGVTFVVRPILKGFKILARPFKRLSQKMRKNKGEDEGENKDDNARPSTQRDEEAVGLTDIKRQPTPDTPVTPVTPVTVPPITITTS